MVVFKIIGQIKIVYILDEYNSKLKNITLGYYIGKKYNGKIFVRIIDAVDNHYFAFEGNSSQISKLVPYDTMLNPPLRRNFTLYQHSLAIKFINTDILDNYFMNLKHSNVFFPIKSLDDILLFTHVPCTSVKIFDTNPFNIRILRTSDLTIDALYY